MSQKNKRKKQAFTLLELMVCLALIALLGGLLVIQGQGLIAHHRFSNALHTLLADLHRAQIVAMTQGRDGVCKLVKEKGHWGAQIVFEVQTTPPMNHELLELNKLAFQGSPVESFQFSLLSSGRIIPSGKLTFFSSQGEEAIEIDLSYPMHLKVQQRQKKFFFDN